MPLKLIRQNLTQVRSDVIVYPADPVPSADGGTALSIYEAAGFEELMTAREELGTIARGDVRYTRAFQLHADWIFHAAGPVYTDGNEEEEQQLRHCYEKSLQMAADLRCRSISFALISSGTFGWPKKEALRIAEDTILNHPCTEDLNVTLCIFDDETVSIASELHDDIAYYIDTHYARKELHKEYRYLEGNRRGSTAPPSFSVSNIFSLPRRKPSRREEAEPVMVDSMPLPEVSEESSSAGMSLQERLAQTDENFHDMLFRLIDERDMSDPEVYKKANIDRKLFSKIRSNSDHIPKKDNVIALCLALKLDIDCTTDLMKRCGYAFSPARKRDLILQYCIENELYDIMKVNAVLYDFNQECL